MARTNDINNDLVLVSPDDDSNIDKSRHSVSLTAKPDDPLSFSPVKHDLENQVDPVFHSDTDTETIGRQIELEAGNSIKYRTCSWQKVN